MPIHEIKNPAPLPAGAEPPSRKTEPVNAVFPVIRVRHLKREWRRRGGISESTGEESLVDGTPESLIRMVDGVNRHLELNGIGIHLRLVKSDDTLSLEIFDCTDGKACEILHDREVSPEQLPDLLKRLQAEAGLIIDTIS